MKKLTGAGNLFHSALDKAAGMLKRKVGTGAEFMQELNSIPGVKKEEILDRKLHDIAGMPKMTHEQFLGELGKRPMPQIEEKVLGQKLTPQELAREANQFIRTRARQYAGENADTSREYRILAGDEMRRLRGEHLPSIREHVEREVAMQDAPHHEKWTLPGGENYREMLIKAPSGEEQFSGVIAHFGGEPGILASMRVKDRTGPNGEKLLHLEELQSDWHQQGREKGYASSDVDSQLKESEQRMAQRGEQIRQLSNRMASLNDSQLDEFNALADERQRLQDLQTQEMDWGNSVYDAQRSGVPDAPFKKNWEEMALKRLIHHAAEKGYHGIVVTPGEVQADRYSLAKQIDDVFISKRPDGKYDLHASKDGQVVSGKNNLNESSLEEYIGKDLAKKAVADLTGSDVYKHPSTGDLQKRYSGLDLQVGGEGMKGFYDKKVPNILNGIGKKYGVKTELGVHTLDTPKMINVGAGAQAEVGRKQTQLHHFPITEEMRQDVLKNGLPLYKEGGEVDAEEVFMNKQHDSDPESMFFPQSKE
jgi:hypothetical protein